jgi:flagellar hook-length control protein FliK
MQTPKLPLPSLGAVPNKGVAPANANVNTNTADAAQFKRTLTRQMESQAVRVAPPQRVLSGPAQPPASPDDAAKTPASVDQSAAVPATEVAPTAGQPASEQGLAQSADLAAVTPMTDMLALAASMQQPPTAPAVTAPAGTAPAETALASAFAALTGNAGARANHKHNLPEGETPAVAALADGRMRAAEAALQSAPPKAEADIEASAAVPVREAGADAAAPAAPFSAQLQQAALAATRSQGAPADKVAARVGTPGWNNQVGQRIVWMVAGKEQSASLTLNPPELGPMQVVLSVTGDQTSITFSSAQPEVRQALENAMPRLREMMSESGISLGDASVNDGMPDAQAGSGTRNTAGGSGHQGGGNADPAEPKRVFERPIALGGGTGMVDTFA